jgi:hypothetical protein
MQPVNKKGDFQSGKKHSLYPLQEKQNPDLRQREKTVPDPDPHESGSDQHL